MQKLRFNHGIFGGSFDPPHLGHLEIIKRIGQVSDEVHLQINMDIVNLTKGNNTPYVRRKRYLEWSLEDAGLLSLNIHICELEYELGLSGYTIHFLEAFKLKHPNQSIAFFIGQDQLDTLNEWVGFPHFLNFAQFVVFKRGEMGPILWHDGIIGIKEKIIEVDWVIPNTSSSEIRKNPELNSKFLTKRVKEAINVPCKSN